MKQLEKSSKRGFLTPEHFAEQQRRRMHSMRGPLVVASCRSANDLAQRIVSKYNRLLREAGSGETVTFLPDIDSQFSDSETRVRLKSHIGGGDVYLLQSLYNPRQTGGVDHNYMAFLIAARTFREHGARHVTAILPYLAYARQDKPTRFSREPTTAKLMSDLSIAAGIDRIISWHPHSGQIRGFYSGRPANMLDPTTLFSEEFSRLHKRDDVVVVAPDAGASKFVTHLARVMGVRSAIAAKYRPEAEEVVTSEVIGSFEGKQIALIIDDIISSGGTLFAVARRLVEQKGIEELYIGASHNLCTESAKEKLLHMHREYGLKQAVFTNSIPQTRSYEDLPFVKVCCLSDTISRTINRIHYNKSVSEVFSQEWS
ncbi:MAG: ribose-phosphate diphosphokinase [Chitinivibrionales bacterium]